MAWLRAFEDGKTNDLQSSYWEHSQPVDALFNTNEDPWEVNNLAGNSWQQSRLEAMKERLFKTMVETRDTGVVPEAMFYQLVGERNVYDYVNDPYFPYKKLLRYLFLATDMEVENLTTLKTALSDSHPVARYWGLMGCALLGNEARSSLPVIRELSRDPYQGNQFAAAYALLQMGYRDESVTLLKELIQKPVTTVASIDAFYVLLKLGESGCLTQEMLDRIERECEGDKNLGYVFRAAQSYYDYFELQPDE